MPYLDQVRRSMLRTGGVLAAMGVVPGCLTTDSTTTHTVEMTSNLRFSPESITIATGQTIEWANTSAIDHTVTAYEDQIPQNAAYFASGGFSDEQTARQNLSRGLIGPDERYAHSFSVPGRYDYFCIPHESAAMAGSIRVQSD